MDLANHWKGNSSMERHTIPKNASDTTSEGVFAGLATGKRMSWPRRAYISSFEEVLYKLDKGYFVKEKIS